jgi:hypothetical protein
MKMLFRLDQSEPRHFASSTNEISAAQSRWIEFIRDGLIKDSVTGTFATGFPMERK